MKLPEYSDVREATERIAGFTHFTPHLSSKSINEICGCEIIFKCENFQKVGAFKFRGATNAVRSLDHDEASRGVATHSSGNHAQALALAAKMLDIPVTIVMPKNAPKVKSDAVAGYGAEIRFCEPTLSARESTLEKVIDEQGSTFIHPYNNYFVIAGQGTAAKELIEDQGFFDYILAPVGGGGLLSGTAISAKHLLPETTVIGCEPLGADDAYRSFTSGKIIPSVEPDTICDGLLTSLGEMTFAIISDKVDEIITVGDDAIIEAMKLIWMRMKIVVEPSSAVPLAVIMQNKLKFAGKKIGVIISGGNVDLKKMALL